MKFPFGMAILRGYVAMFVSGSVYYPGFCRDYKKPETIIRIPVKQPV